MSMEERLRAFLAEDPDDPMVLMSLGGILVRDGRFEEGIDVLRRATTVDPDYMAAYPLLGECFEHSGEVDEARSAYLRALELAREASDGTMEEEMREKLEGLEDGI